MDLMAQCGEQYKISLDPSYRRGDYPEKWRYYEIRGKDGTLWPYSETHLVVLFYHSWRSRIDADGDVIWIPSRRSQKGKRFQTLAGDDGEVFEVVTDSNRNVMVVNPGVGRRVLTLIEQLQRPKPVHARTGQDTWL